MHIKKSYDVQEHKQIRESFMKYVRKVVPSSLLLTVFTGPYFITQVFVTIGEEGMSSFQVMLSIKVFLGVWLGARGFAQVLSGYSTSGI